MSMIIGSLKRRNEAMQNECDTLAQGIDHLSNQLTEAYSRLQKYEPEYVDRMLNPNKPQTDVPAPAAEAMPAASAEPAEV